MNILEQMASRVPTLTIADAKVIVESWLGISINFVDPDSRNATTNEPREVRSDANLAKRLRKGRRIELRGVFAASLPGNGEDVEDNDSDEAAAFGGGSVGVVALRDPHTMRAPPPEGNRGPASLDSPLESNLGNTLGTSTYYEMLLEQFIREMDAQEKRRSFVWIGFVIKTMLPGFGLRDDEVQPFLHRVEADELVIKSQRPNPKNPDYPTTGIQLNRIHPAVQRVLQQMESRSRRLPLGAVRGEPLSQTIIRERR